jgi:uncharacterized protein
MRTSRFTYRGRIAAPAPLVFDWHTRDGALERLTPPWERVVVEERIGGLQDGDRVVLRIPLGPLRLRWEARHRDYIPGRQFCDEQVRGPFARWVHTHRVEPDGPSACWLEDAIEYALPAGALTGPVGERVVRSKLRRLFAYRHAVLRADLASGLPGPPRRIAVSGSRGLVGSALLPYLTTQGHEVIRLRRGAGESGGAAWDPARGLARPADLEGVDAVVHLAGENIAARRWTTARKAEIRRSRVDGTRALCESLAGLSCPPRVLVSASAIGFYGDRGSELLAESSPRGAGFLADVAEAWEAAAGAAEQAGIRVVHLRFGVILSPAGGALRKMLFPFRMGLGGRVGSGDQFWSWVAIDDAVGAIAHAIRCDALRGPVNVVAPTPAANREFTATLARVLRRPALFPAPAGLLRLVLGEMADALLLSSARVQPARLQASGYRFRFPDLEAALRHLLGRHA